MIFVINPFWKTLEEVRIYGLHIGIYKEKQNLLQRKKFFLPSLLNCGNKLEVVTKSKKNEDTIKIEKLYLFWFRNLLPRCIRYSNIWRFNRHSGRWNFDLQHCKWFPSEEFFCIQESRVNGIRQPIFFCRR